MVRVSEIKLNGKGETLIQDKQSTLDFISDWFDFQCDDGCEYTIKIKNMDNEEYDNLPEFDGF